MEAGDNININFKGSLLRCQNQLKKTYLKNRVKRRFTAIISIRRGGGKTVLALHIISVLKKKQLLLFIKIFNDYKKIENNENFTKSYKNTRIQLILKVKDVVLAMVQSLSNYCTIANI